MKKLITLATSIFILQILNAYSVSALAPTLSISSPYKIQNGYNIKANLHAHTNYGPGPVNGTTNFGACINDDGWDSPSQAAQWYQDHGFGFYALTGHVDLHYTRCNGYDFTLYQSTVQISGKTFVNTSSSGVQGTYILNAPIINAGLSVPSVWAGPSMELNMYPYSPITVSNPVGGSSTANGVHVSVVNMGSAIRDSVGGFAVPDYPMLLQDGPSGVTSAINNIIANGGIAIVNHPTTAAGYSAQSADYVAKIKGITGVEVRNGPNDYSSFWDSQLKAGNYIWGFGNDDGHNYISVGGVAQRGSEQDRGDAFIVFKNGSNSMSRDVYLSQIKLGDFIVSTPPDSNYNGYIDNTSTKISLQDNYYDLSVKVGPDNLLSAETIRGDNIKWIEDGVVKKVSTGKIDFYKPSVTAKYVRLEVFAQRNGTSAKVAYSQPLIISSPPMASQISPSKSSVIESAQNKLANVNLTAQASDVNPGHAVSFAPIWRQIKDSNGIDTIGEARAWHNFGCKTTHYSDGSAAKSRYPDTVEGCSQAAAQNINNYGWIGDSYGATVFINQNTPYSFPALTLGLGTYEWTVRAYDEDRVYSTSWSSVNTFKVVESFSAIDTPRWMTVNSDTYKIDPDASRSIDGLIPSGVQIKLVSKLAYGDEWLLRTQHDDLNNLRKGIISGKLSEIQYTQFETPRYMKINKNTYKTNPLTDRRDSAMVYKDSQYIFDSKVYVNGIWYFRTAADTKSGISFAINSADLEDLHFESNGYPKWLQLKYDVNKASVLTGLNYGQLIGQGTQLKVVDKIYLGGQWFYRTYYDYSNGNNMAILASSFEEISYESMKTPRIMRISSNLRKIDPKTGRAVDGILSQAMEIRFESKISINGVIYLRTKFDTDLNYNKAIAIANLY